MGTDLSVVNAAKVSFGKLSEWSNGLQPLITAYGYDEEGRSMFYKVPDPDFVGKLSEKDQGLIQFLARGCTSGDWEDLSERLLENTQVVDGEWTEWFDPQELEDLLNHIRKMPSHWSPFAHTAVTLHLKMPIFVARQIMKHTTGIEYNEVSRRYVDSEPEFYVPDVWRKKADNVKQGSSDEAVANYQSLWEYDSVENDYNAHMNEAAEFYKHLLSQGVAPEQARMVLPQSMYTEVIATGNLYAWANMYIQRSDSHAQEETQVLAKQMGDIFKPLYPVSWDALTK